MNNQSPLVPQGSTLDQKNKGRARVKIAVFFVLAVHGVGLLALLMQGCRREEPAAQTTEQNTNPPPQAFVEPTNAPPSNAPSAVVVPPPAAPSAVLAAM